MTLSVNDLRGVSAADGTTKAKIERAALTLFAQRSIDGVSTREIAAKAEISEGAIYRHFKSKDELARDLMKAIHLRLTDMIEAAVHGNAHLPDQIRFIVDHYCIIADDDWDLFRYHILHLHHFPRLSDGPDDSPIAAAANLLTSAMKRGEISRQDPFMLAAMCLGVVLQTAQAKIYGYIDGPLGAKTHVFSAAIFNVLGIDETHINKEG